VKAARCYGQLVFYHITIQCRNPEELDLENGDKKVNEEESNGKRGNEDEEK
jgi:hypothetical protein